MNYTVILYTSNEERRIQYVLRNFSGRAHIIVIDNFSSDRTAAIARAAGATVYLVKNSGYTTNAAKREHLKLAPTAWVFVAYAAELVTRPMLDLFDKIALQDRYDAVRHFRLSYTYGRPVNWGDRVRVDRSRFFRRDAVDFERAVIHDEFPLVCPPSRILDADPGKGELLIQFRDYDAKTTELRHSVYADVEADEWVKRGVKVTPVGLLIRPLKIFVLAYIRGGAYRAGTAGFLYAAWRAVLYFNICARVWETTNGLSLRSSIEMHRVLKESVLDDIEKHTKAQ